MRLGSLKAAIRATKGNPVIQTRLWSDGPMMTLALQKAVLLEELDAAYPGGKAVETDLIFDEKTGILRPDGGAVGQVERTTVSDLTHYRGEPAGPLLDIMEDDLLGEVQTEPATSTGLDDLFV